MSGISSTLTGGLKPPSSIPANPTVLQIGANLQGLTGGTTATTTSASLGDAINISGASGVLQFACVLTAAGITVSPSEFKVTIDGVVVYDETGSIGALQSKMAVGTAYDGTGEMGVVLDTMIFNNSCRVEFASDGVDTLSCITRHYLT